MNTHLTGDERPRIARGVLNSVPPPNIFLFPYHRAPINSARLD
jgi:hypothetical protein